MQTSYVTKRDIGSFSEDKLVPINVLGRLLAINNPVIPQAQPAGNTVAPTVNNPPITAPDAIVESEFKDDSSFEDAPGYDSSNTVAMKNLFGFDYKSHPKLDMSKESVRKAIGFYNGVLDAINYKYNTFNVKYRLNGGRSGKELQSPLLIIGRVIPDTSTIEAVWFTHTIRNKPSTELSDFTKFIRAVARHNMWAAKLGYIDVVANVSEFITESEYNKIRYELVATAANKSIPLYQILSEMPPTV